MRKQRNKSKPRFEHVSCQSLFGVSNFFVVVLNSSKSCNLKRDSEEEEDKQRLTMNTKEAVQPVVDTKLSMRYTDSSFFF